jgi:alkanesulfonate monooxygenase SsuD/methylene tetrahydromethanopterin reductase-like flavin-dependent oxidoreductase (luciferase family)
MTTGTFRFAAQAVPRDGASWLGTATRAEELGYSTLLMPDGMQLLSPLPALALAAGATTSLRVGTFVLASPLRAPRLAAWDAHTLSLLTGGRFELGIGTGRPEVEQESVRLLGQPPTTGARRLALVEQTIDELRLLDGERHTPVLMAVAGPRARAVAAAKADNLLPQRERRVHRAVRPGRGTPRRALRTVDTATPLLKYLSATCPRQ